jgi:nucleoside-triphosphatase THEP1
VRGFEQIILPAVLADLPHKEFIIIDEIGPMSFFSAQFKPFLDELFASGKPIIGTICLRPIPGVDEVKARPGVELIKLTPANRDQVPNEISQKLSTQ